MGECPTAVGQGCKAAGEHQKRHGLKHSSNNHLVCKSDKLGSSSNNAASALSDKLVIPQDYSEDPEPTLVDGWHEHEQVSLFGLLD